MNRAGAEPSFTVQHTDSPLAASSGGVCPHTIKLLNAPCRLDGKQEIHPGTGMTTSRVEARGGRYDDYK